MKLLLSQDSVILAQRDVDAFPSPLPPRPCPNPGQGLFSSSGSSGSSAGGNGGSAPTSIDQNTFKKLKFQDIKNRKNGNPTTN